jgi:CBS domain-containing protein
MNIASILARKGGKVATCRPEQSIRQALALLAEHNIGALVVVDETAVPAGMLSERDIVREAARDERLFGRSVGEIMTRDVIVGVPEDDLRAVRHTMTERRIRHVRRRGRAAGRHRVDRRRRQGRARPVLGEVDTLQTQVGARP